MHLAILVTNTDKSEFAGRHPKDDRKFSDLVRLTRPDWQLTGFAVHEGEFPSDITQFDGVLITGSPTSTRSDLPWIRRLLDLIQDMHAARLPVFGACFGHQAIALALGGEIDHSPHGWAHGLIPNQITARPPWMAQLPAVTSLYGSHCEYVAELPEDAVETATSNGQNAGFRISNHIWTSQHHPEMSHDFITALTEEMRDTLGPEVHSKAMSSLKRKSDQRTFSESIAQFFEQAGRNR